MNPHDQVHKQLEHELTLYKMMINASLDSITLIDRSYVYRIVTDAYLRARQLSREEVLNHSVAEVWGQEVFDKVIKARLDECFAGRTVSDIAAYEFNKNEINYIETIYTPCFTSNAQAAYAIVISHNITELKKTQEKIKSLAFNDALTNLPSRPLFVDLLNREIDRAQRSQKAIAVFFFDLDGFKKINDTFGHATGDEVLAGVAKRLQKSLRRGDIISRPGSTDSDSSGSSDYVARIGGDEFSFIIPDISVKSLTTGIARRILDLFKEPFRLMEREIHVSTSIGIAFYPEDGTDVETLIKNADQAMYKAKQLGRNTFCYYKAAP